MDTLKFILFSIIVLVLVGILGYWAVATIKSGPEFASNQKIQQLQNENADLTKQVAELTDKLNIIQAQTVTPAPVAQNLVVATPTTPVKTTTYKNQNLINELQKLVTANVVMKLNSSGTRVGTVENFLNIYNNTIIKIDNDYGANTVKAVAAFQKTQGLTANGQADSNTFNKMISWLKKQG